MIRPVHFNFIKVQQTEDSWHAIAGLNDPVDTLYSKTSL